ncbi:MAG: L-seryl-tRNA(Sec) selenium transferase, partial [Candidatus Binatia bacterium]|nr:L-seryl-tRNA(Sec) selenium transferase [Candidatus Binatia bacterium]
MEQAKNLLREIPSVDHLLKHPRSGPLLERFKREYVLRKCREILDGLRRDLKQGKKIPGVELRDE